MNGIFRKLSGRKGFTLAEMMACTIIMLLTSGVITNLLTMGIATYQDMIWESDADALYERIVPLVRQQLSRVEDVETIPRRQDWGNGESVWLESFHIWNEEREREEEEPEEKDRRIWKRFGTILRYAADGSPVCDFPSGEKAEHQEEAADGQLILARDVTAGSRDGGIVFYVNKDKIRPIPSRRDYRDASASIRIQCAGIQASETIKEDAFLVTVRITAAGAQPFERSFTVKPLKSFGFPVPDETE